MRISVTIDATNVEELEARLAKYSKKVSEKAYIVSKTAAYLRPIPPYTIAFQRVVDVEIEVPNVADKIVAGYRVVAIIDYRNSPNKDIAIITVLDPKFEAEALEFRSVKASRCDHCHSNRKRVINFLLHNDEKNELVCIGSTCVKDFLQTSLDYLKLWNLSTQLEEGIHKELSGVGDNPRNWYFKTDDALAVAVHFIDEYGFKSAKAADEERSISTRDRMREFYLKPRTTGSIQLLEDNSKMITEEEKELGSKVLHWMRDSKDKWFNNTAFANNMLTAISMDSVNYVMFGFLAFAVKMYRDDLVAPKKEIEYIGSIGEKLTLDLKFVSKYVFQNSYFSDGANFVYTFNDASGNILQWFTASEIDFKVGETYKIRGTVKKHDTYKGSKRTYITRCKVL